MNFTFLRGLKRRSAPAGTVYDAVDVPTATFLATENNLSEVAPSIARTNILPSKTGNALKVLRVNAGGTDFELATISGATVGDGDYGDITVSSSGAVWTIDNDTVTNAKMSNMANSTIKGRTTAGTGDPEDLTASQVKTILSLNNVVNLDTSTTSNISDSSNKRFITDAQQTVLGNTSGANSGDNAANSSSQPLDSDLTTIAAISTAGSGTLSSDGSGWILKTYSALKAALSLTKSDVGLSNVVNSDTTTTANITDSSNKRFVTDANLVVIGNTSGTNSGNETTTTIGSLINGATAKTTPVDADFVGLMDSAASNVLKKLSWLNFKATLKTYFDTLYQVTGTYATGGGTATGNNTGDNSANSSSQPVNSNLTTIAGLTATTNNFLVAVSSAWASRTPAQVKTTLSLDNVDNTSDANKPVSSATTTALNLKANLASPTFTGTVTLPASQVVNGVTLTTGGSTSNFLNANGVYSAPTAVVADGNKGDITVAATGATWTINGRSVDNTKLASMATQTFKGRNTALTGDPEDLSVTTVKTMLSISNLDNTSDANKPVSTTQQTALNLKSNLASPTFTGTPTLPTGTIATTQTANNNSTAIATTAYVDAADALKSNLASPTFTGTPALPTGTIATTQSAGNSTTAIATTAFATTADNLKANIASPTFTGLITVPTGTTTVAPINFPTGVIKTSGMAAGDVEFDGVQYYQTIDTTSGRGAIPVEQYFHLTATGGLITTIANYFGANSNISLVASAYYEIEIILYYLKTTAGTVTWTLTNSVAPTGQNIYYEMAPITGLVAPPGTTTMLNGHIYNDATAARTVVTGSLTTAVNHYAYFRIQLRNGTGTSLKIQATCSAGSITPGINSYWICKRRSANNVGTFAA